MRITDTVVIGAGQAGRAASRCLADRGRDHAVLERGRIGQRWRSEALVIDPAGGADGCAYT